MSRPNKVYLLMHASGQSFKIGIAVQTHRRASALPDDIDMANSLEAVVTTGKAESVEKILHYLCRDLSTKAERIERGEVGDGYTEWFAAEAFDQARAFIDGHAAMLGVSPLRPVQVPEKHEQPGPRKREGSAKPSKAEKAEAARKWLAESKEATERQNLRVLSTASDMIARMWADEVLVGMDLADDGCMYLYLRGTHALLWAETLTRPNSDLLVCEVGGGGRRLFNGFISPCETIAQVGVWTDLVVNSSPATERMRRVPCTKDFREMFLRQVIWIQDDSLVRSTAAAVEHEWQTTHVSPWVDLQRPCIGG